MRNSLIIAAGIIILGMCWWVAWDEIVKETTRKKASEYLGGASNTQEKPVKIYTGKWRKDYLEIVKR